MSFRMALRPLMVAAAVFVFVHVAAAQAKVAVINLQKAVLESAEIKAASAAMEARYKPRVTQIETPDVLKKLGEEKGYDIVVDAPYAPYFKAALDITTDLIVAYDKAYPAAAPAPKK